ncbi:uncharacterized protein K02A2.6-like [Synchiropus splendidus]|uniref:uncharacterized protein K02A2.6-like n=1 Tax=Synchiropus splendidus TaxID=270530 RepID=UPI00237D4B22|nr:uncharacterized protein K02A2.6-like [Synchiropus splendidus]
MGGGKVEIYIYIVDDTDLCDTFFVELVNRENESSSEVNTVSADKWIETLKINGTLVTVKLDTGAKANLISMSDIKAMTMKPKIYRKTLALKDYNGKEIKCLGSCHLSVNVKGKNHQLMFSVIPEGLDLILRDKACESLELVRRVYCINRDVSNNTVDMIVEKYDEPFTYKIRLKENAQPVVHAARRIPAPLREQLRKELDRMTMLGVSKKVDEPTDWVNSMVCVKKKNGDLRICMDPKDLNENIKREHYQIPKRDGIINEMAGAKYFSKLDASQGFWQLKLDENSTKYCTFNTSFGRYCFLRLPFGIIFASEIFHKAMDIDGLNGVCVYVDDIIWGSTIQEHNERLILVFEQIQKYGLKLNKQKCQFGVNELVFLGDKLSAQGVQADTSRQVHCMLSPMKRQRKVCTFSSNC